MLWSVCCQLGEGNNSLYCQLFLVICIFKAIFYSAIHLLLKIIFSIYVSNSKRNIKWRSVRL